MTASLPDAVQAVFDRFITTEYTTIDGAGRPITWPVTPYYRLGDPCIDVTTGLGYPKKANDARGNPKVSLLFSDPTGSGLSQPPAVLVQGTADVDDRDLRANWARYDRELAEKLPGAKEMNPPDFMKRFFGWYYMRIYVHVRPERVYVWEGGDIAGEPQLFDCHMEEVRSGHDEEPESQATPEGGAAAWDERVGGLGSRTYPTAVLRSSRPTGSRSPCACQSSAAMPRAGRVDRRRPAGRPARARGCACLTAHDHAPASAGSATSSSAATSTLEDAGWASPRTGSSAASSSRPGSMVSRMRTNFQKTRRFRSVAKQELERRESRLG